jgi:hypothetical protein
MSHGALRSDDTDAPSGASRSGREKSSSRIRTPAPLGRASPGGNRPICPAGLVCYLAILRHNIKWMNLIFRKLGQFGSPSPRSINSIWHSLSRLSFHDRKLVPLHGTGPLRDTDIHQEIINAWRTSCADNCPPSGLRNAYQHASLCCYLEPNARPGEGLGPARNRETNPTLP